MTRLQLEGMLLAFTAVLRSLVRLFRRDGYRILAAGNVRDWWTPADVAAFTL